MHALALLVSLAHAQDAVTLDVVRYGQVGTATPVLRLTPQQDATALDVRFDCGGRTFTRNGPAGAGEVVTMPLDLPQGKHTCRGSLSVELSDGSAGDMPLSFAVEVLPPMKITLLPDRLDLQARRVGITLDRPASKVEVTALGARGVELATGLLPTSAAPGTPIEAEWGVPAGEPIKLRVRAWDVHGFWSELLVSVWSYAIPHEDVVFATNSATIEATEEPKLEAALAEARKVYARYEGEVQVRLYVGGHTDTVGDSAFNAELSGRRALALAKWFDENGFPGPIYWYGFGESRLAVPTGDGVDEPRNRRAEYTLAGAPPPGQGGAWKLLE